MTNLLTHKLPTTVRVGNLEYKINTDFRIGLKIITAFEDPELTMQEKCYISISLLYPEVPNNIEEATRVALKFLNFGEEYEETKKPAVSSIGRLYSFTQDAPFIFTAINQTHGIDLEAVPYLHWWKFNAYFMDLDEKCFFSKLIYLRKQKKTGKWTKEEREWYYQIRDIADLELDRLEIENNENLKIFFSQLGTSPAED